MGMWYLSAIVFVVFGGLFYILSGERINATENYRSSVAGLIGTCRQAGLQQIYGSPTWGNQSAPSTAGCSAAGLPQSNTAISQNINVPVVQLTGYLTSHVSSTPLTPDHRNLVVYVPPTDGSGNATTINGTSFNEVVRQLRAAFPDQSMANFVVADSGTPAHNALYKWSGTEASRVPSTVPIGSFAIVATTNSLGWATSTGCVTSGSICGTWNATPVSFSQAYANCVKQGGTLAKVKSSSDVTALQGVVPSGTTLWIDTGRKPTDSSKWVYFGSDIEAPYAATLPSPANWASGQPDNAGGNENCVSYSRDTGKLSDVACSGSLPYACTF